MCDSWLLFTRRAPDTYIAIPQMMILFKRHFISDGKLRVPSRMYKTYYVQKSTIWKIIKFAVIGIFSISVNVGFCLLLSIICYIRFFVLCPLYFDLLCSWQNFISMQHLRLKNYRRFSLLSPALKRSLPRKSIVIILLQLVSFLCVCVCVRRIFANNLVTKINIKKKSCLEFYLINLVDFFLNHALKF